jgi:hypothetical protein
VRPIRSRRCRFAQVSTPPGQNPYAYSPYGSPYPAAGQDPAPPVRRPRLLIVAPLLMLVASLPFLFFGGFFLLAPLDGLVQELLSSPRMQQAGASADLVILAGRILGGIMVAVAVLYLLSGFLAFAGRNWARIVTAVFTVGFALLLMAALVASGGAVDTITLTSVLLILIVAAAAILFSPGANAWYTSRR